MGDDLGLCLVWAQGANLAVGWTRQSSSSTQPAAQANDDEVGSERDISNDIVVLLVML